MEVARIVAQLSAAWPAEPITLRADSGFYRDALVTWCETDAVDYVFGLAKNARLIALIAKDLNEAAATCTATNQQARVLTDLTYATLESWTEECRVVAEAERLTTANVDGVGKSRLCSATALVSVGAGREERNWPAVALRLRLWKSAV